DRADGCRNARHVRGAVDRGATPGARTARPPSARAGGSTVTIRENRRTDGRTEAVGPRRSERRVAVAGRSTTEGHPRRSPAGGVAVDGSCRGRIDPVERTGRGGTAPAG